MYLILKVYLWVYFLAGLRIVIFIKIQVSEVSSYFYDSISDESILIFWNSTKIPYWFYYERFSLLAENQLQRRVSGSLCHWAGFIFCQYQMDPEESTPWRIFLLCIRASVPGPNVLGKEPGWHACKPQWPTSKCIIRVPNWEPVLPPFLSWWWGGHSNEVFVILTTTVQRGSLKPKIKRSWKQSLARSRHLSNIFSTIPYTFLPG